MSNQYLQAADDAKRLLRGFAAVQTLADVFEKIGSIDQARAEAEAALLALTPKVAAAKAQVAAAEQSVLDAESSARQVADDAKSAANEVIAVAHDEANRLRAEAEAFVANAKVQAESIIATAEADVTAATQRCSDLASEVANLEERAAKARAYLAKLQG